MKPLRILSLFTGAGGLDLGFVSTKKFEVLLANEILNMPVETYSKNFNVKIEESKIVSKERLPAVFPTDIQNLNIDELEKMDIDVVIGGPPCQDFSIVRGPSQERKGIEVKRGRLYEHFIRSLKQTQPKAFIFENVPGLVSANKRSAFETILNDFEELTTRWSEVKKDLKINNGEQSPVGYHIIFKNILNLSRLGVPQSRRRLIIVGLRKDFIDAKVLERIKTEFTNNLNINSTLNKFPLTPLEIFEGKTLPELQNQYTDVMKEYDGVWSEVGTETAMKWKKEVWDNGKFNIIQDYLKINKIGEVENEELRRAFAEHEKILKEMEYWKVRVDEAKVSDETQKIPNGGSKNSVSERMKRIPPGENFEFVKGTDWQVEGRGMSLIYRRLHPLKPSYTIVAYGGGGTWGYHYKKERSTLTNRERARLQTFPDWFSFKGNFSQVRAQIGEAVPPLASKRIAESLLKLNLLV
jgi:DNA (cytosine-5)-methyltransferase 1